MRRGPGSGAGARVRGGARQCEGRSRRDQRDGRGRGRGHGTPPLAPARRGRLRGTGRLKDLSEEPAGGRGGGVAPAVFPLSDGAAAGPDVGDEYRVGRQGGTGLGRRERLLGEMRQPGKFGQTQARARAQGPEVMKERLQFRHQGSRSLVGTVMFFVFCGG